ncbi:von Willebrand factor type A (fragment) [uncultured delta proteobacterium]|uniref:von Willebrand factor type A n=1 Tax=uncultured delta proteobacterium TaxID=34034 RepID=A0A212KFL9_9DELT
MRRCSKSANLDSFILAHGQAMHSRFSTNAGGGTPMDAALWWVMQQIHPLSEPRKIILVITDGDPDDKEAARETIRTSGVLGLEVYGIGIQTQSILNLLPDKHCRVITSINELAPAMFGMLHNALIG